MAHSPVTAVEKTMPHVDGVEHHVVAVNGVRLHYAAAGQGEPVVLLHGWPQHWWSWRHVIASLAKSYRVICPDIRGLGWSEGSADGFGFTALAGDLVGLLDVLGISRARLVGHDWGSIIGYRACLDRPDRFIQFVALGGLTPWSSEGARPRLWLRPWHIYVLAARGAHPATRLRIAEHALRSWRYIGGFSPGAVQVYLDPLRRPPAARATHAYYRNVVRRELVRYAVHHRRLRLDVPTLHLNGEHDPLTKGVPDSYRRYADDMRLEILPGCGHFIAEERPEILLERLHAFFAPTTVGSTTDGNQ